MPGYLVVDDSPSIRATLTRYLETILSDPPLVHEAEHVERALELFMREQPDVVLLDMMVPLHASDDGASTTGEPTRARPHGGVEALKAMLRANPHARIIVVTALSRDHDEVAVAISLGARGYLRKPVDRHDLREALLALD